MGEHFQHTSKEALPRLKPLVPTGFKLQESLNVESGKMSQDTAAGG